jgi:predicted Zn-dependent peptidase
MFDLYFDDPDRLNHEIDRLRAVTVEQIRDFVASQLGSDNRAVLVYEPKRKS